MRTNAISLVIIALALLAIGAGFASGQVGAHPPAIVSLRAGPAPRVSAPTDDARYSDMPVRDLFSRDDVVVARHTGASARWLAPQLSLVVGLCGASARIESAFLHLGLPIAYDLDPHAPEALAFARDAQAAHAELLVHVNEAPSPAVLTALRARFGAIAGVASRTSAGMARALAGSGLVFFDERGTADPRAFADAHVPFVARNTTVDDRTGEGYVLFMLDRAELRSEHEGRLVVLMRPLPSTLTALESFLRTRSVQIAALTPSGRSD